MTKTKNQAKIRKPISAELRAQLIKGLMAFKGVVLEDVAKELGVTQEMLTQVIWENKTSKPLQQKLENYFKANLF